MPLSFSEAIEKHQSDFGIELSSKKITSLDQYYSFLLKHNPILHLVGKCDAEEFATRHILESIYLLSIVSDFEHLTDVGAGAGLPGIPCLIADSRLKGSLVESKIKKSTFLNEAIVEIGIKERCTVINRQFEEIKRSRNGLIVSRALDKFAKKLRALIRWSAGRQLALFAGEAVREELDKQNIRYESHLIPMSERRFIFVADLRRKSADDS
jgi:16S rRNA (guanine527-N7)-methyltransferase